MKPWTKIIKKKQIDGFENVYKPAYWHNSYEYIPTRTQIMMSKKKKNLYMLSLWNDNIYNLFHVNSVCDDEENITIKSIQRYIHIVGREKKNGILNHKINCVI